MLLTAKRRDSNVPFPIFATAALLGFLLLWPATASGIDVDFLFNYYDQDGNHSPVTGGIGTEDQQVMAPVIVLRWAANDKWTLSANLGVDNITSASTDNIDTEVSSASYQDSRGHTYLSASRQLGRDTWTFGVGFSTEYDYRSLNGSLAWSRDFNNRNTTLGAGLRHFQDTVDLYDIDGVQQGEDDRTTTEFSVSLSHILGPRTVIASEFTFTSQSGFLSTPFHEVILAPTPDFPEGQRVAERLPDQRDRMALGVSLNHAFSKKIVQRFSYRLYDDDFGIMAHSIESETHFRLPTDSETWIFPILRFHTQTASDYFGLPGTFTAADPYFTADRDLSEFTSEKFGVGFRWQRQQQKTKGWLKRLRAFESRVASYSREDGLDAFTVSLALSWRF